MIEIMDYQERWPQEFLRIGREIKTALGERAVRVDHIGSTSVPGLASKDIIDVQLTLVSFAEFELVRASLVGELGYVFREWVVADHRPRDNARPEQMNGDPDWEKRYFREPAGLRPIHLHVRIANRANQRYALLFRDFLRARGDMANAYAELKRRLAAALGDGSDPYPDIKDPVCDLVIYAAEDWAEKTGWEMGNSDI